MIDPIAFYIGNYPIKWYGIMMFLALFSGFLLWKKISREKGINKIISLELYIYPIIGLFIGCRLFHVLVYEFDAFLLDPLGLLFARGGLSSHGGMIGAILATYIYTKKKKLPFWYLIDYMILPVALAVGFIRIGNFINGEIVGRITNVPWAVKFKSWKGIRHPVQLYEAAKNFLVFAILYYAKEIKQTNLPRGFIFLSFFFLFSLLRFFTEFFKEYQVLSSGLTIGQWLSLIIVIISGVMLYLIYYKKIELT